MANWLNNTAKKVTNFAKQHPNITTLGATWAANQMGLGSLEALNQAFKAGKYEYDKYNKSNKSLK